MERTQKTAFIEELSETFRQNPHLIVAGFAGLRVDQATELRRRIRATGGAYRVVKNRLAKRAAGGTAVEQLAEHFGGMRAVATHETDPVALAKVLSEFAKENPELQIVAGVVDARDVVDADGIKRLASLPGVSELRARLLALLNTPATSLLRLLNTPATQLATVTDARRKRLESGESSSGS